MLWHTRHTQRSTACTHALFASVFLLFIHYTTFSALCYLKFQLNPFAQYCKNRFPYDRYYIKFFGLSQHGFAYTMHELPVPTRHILLQFPLLHPPNIITTLSSRVNLKTNRYEIPSLSISKSKSAEQLYRPTASPARCDILSCPYNFWN